MKFIRKTAALFLVYTALAILLLHTLVPHVHHGEINDHIHSEVHHQADDLIDWLALFFHHDMGEGHLEQFANLDKTQLNVCCSALSFDIDFFIKTHFSFAIKHISHFTKAPPCFDRTTYTHFASYPANSLRAPPLLV